MRDRLFRAYQKRRLCSPFLRKGVSIIPGARRLHRFLYEHVRPSEMSVTANGLELFVDPADEVLAQHLLQGRAWEPFETVLFEETIRPGMTVVDVGANVGYHTLAAGRLVGAAGRVIAFEPEPRNFDLLRRNVERNGLAQRATLIQAAVGECTGTSLLYRDAINFGAHSISQCNVVGGDSISVPCVSLRDALRAEDLIRLDVLKIDVQGAEGMVIAGAGDLLDRGHIRIFMELWPQGLQRAGTDALALLETLTRQHQFRCKVIDEAREELIEVEDARDAVSRCIDVESVNLVLERT